MNYYRPIMPLPENRKKIAKIIFSKVLEMPLAKYLAFVEKTTGLTKPYRPDKKNLFYARIMVKNEVPFLYGSR